MSTMSPEDIRSKVEEHGRIQPWNHNYSLPGGIETRPGEQRSHGKNLIKIERLKPLFEIIGLQGKNVLDVGCNEGFFSFFMAEKGATVQGIDIDTHRVDKAKFIKSVKGTANVQFDVVDIYCERFRAMPHADLCLCLGFLHRVPDPFSAVAALVEKTDMIVFEWKALKFGPHDDAFAYFSPKGIDHKDYYGTEYWLLSYAALERVLQRLGFAYFHRVDDPRQRRAILVAGRKPHAIFERPHAVIGGGRIMALLRHTKRYVRTMWGVLTGRINA